MNEISLNGTWRFQIADLPARSIRVPAAWETVIADKTLAGPAIYTRTFGVPESWRDGAAVRLCFGAVSHHARVFVNGQPAGEHTGLWSEFECDVTQLLRHGKNELRVEVTKQGEQFPPRKWLGGFLPDVCTTFGGIWQSVTLRRGDARQTQSRPGAVWRAESDRITRDGAPVHVRGVLDWGWHPRTIAPLRTRAEVQRMIRQVRGLGFNLIKACLYVPDDVFFEACETADMAVWLELPMWQPAVDAAYKQHVLREYEAILRRVSRFGCIAVLSLGCELDAQTDATFLGRLTALAKRHLPHALFNDNSGSAEAYGGAATSLGEFYDYHFYCEPHQFDALCNHFGRAHRPRKPWLFGEYCDADTAPAHDMRAVWWLRDAVPEPKPELHAMRACLGDAQQRKTLKRLQPIARAQTTAVRKFIIERTRLRHAGGGYVLTGWQDTPITTSGMLDHDGREKFDPREWRAFNADRVLLLDRARTRAWTHGGDQPDHTEPFCVWAREPYAGQLVLANGGAPVDVAEAAWKVVIDEAVVARGRAPSQHAATGHVPLADIAWVAPGVTKPTEAMLHAHAKTAQGALHNAWRFLILPGRAQTLASLQQHPWHEALSPELLREVASGATRMLWLREPAAFTAHMPFWREAIHDFVPHPFWRKLPQFGCADLRMHGLASEFAIDADALQAALTKLGARNCTLNPIWRRYDARKFVWHDYLLEARIGKGRLFVGTLRFAGGLGQQPNRFETNPLGAWMLHALSGQNRTSRKDPKAQH